ncbi:1103_t:CDS:1, partial [Ambispora leptoticha]
EVLLEKTKSIASNVGEQNFRGSHGWLARFKAQHRIKAYVRVGE